MFNHYWPSNHLGWTIIGLLLLVGDNYSIYSAMFNPHELNIINHYQPYFKSLPTDHHSPSFQHHWTLIHHYKLTITKHHPAPRATLHTVLALGDFQPPLINGSEPEISGHGNDQLVHCWRFSNDCQTLRHNRNIQKSISNYFRTWSQF